MFRKAFPGKKRFLAFMPKYYVNYIMSFRVFNSDGRSRQCVYAFHKNQVVFFTHY